MFGFKKKTPWTHVADRVLLEFIKIGDQDTSQPDDNIAKKVLFNFYGQPDSTSPTSSLTSEQLYRYYKEQLETKEAFKKSETYKNSKQPDPGLHPTTITMTNCAIDCLFIEDTNTSSDVLNKPGYSRELFEKIYNHITKRIS